MKASNDFLFMLDGDVQLIVPETLRLLVQTAATAKLGVLAPLVTMGGKLFSNFWGALGANGYYARSEDYVEIVDGKRVGIWNVPFINGALLISKEKVRPKMTLKYICVCLAGVLWEEC
ncbi:unnamed protein product [Gongylonema pulchrum]|uniref:Glyco_trans_2-like domain-containing protein n=1 Tax=Gongylonema pulchrum TaxID=637853 RepID=A0A183F0Q1_9BILA|nr:unnamed protein product [Gongylonema pulchrum]